MTTIKGEKKNLIKCPFGCNQELHYGFFITGKHVCGGKVDSKTKKELKDTFNNFRKEIDDILSQYDLRMKVIN